MEKYWINLTPQLWLHWRHEKTLFSCHLLLNNARASAVGRTVWTCMIYWKDLWRPLANTCGIFCAFCEFHLKATFLLPPKTNETKMSIYTPWKLCQLILYHTATEIFAKVQHRQIWIFGSLFVEPFWTRLDENALLRPWLGNDGRSGETQLGGSQVNQAKALGDFWQI